jgi:tetratricopeptide (TPR) repeat protein
MPARRLPLMRLGEIEFLRRRYDDAARDFGAAARRSGDPGAEAAALLDRGAALVAAGRRDEGEDALREADDLAWHVKVRLLGVLDGVSYYARVQLGEAAREAGALPAAAEAYAAARELVPDVEYLTHKPHVEQLENNAAIVDIALGRPAAAGPPPGAR